LVLTESNNNFEWDKDLEKTLKKKGLENSPLDIIHKNLQTEFNRKLYIGFFGSPRAGKSTLKNSTSTLHLEKGRNQKNF